MFAYGQLHSATERPTSRTFRAIRANASVFNETRVGSLFAICTAGDVTKSVLHRHLNDGTFTGIQTYLIQDDEVLTKTRAHRPMSRPKESEEAMDAKYNWIIDNTGIRMALNVAAFTVWLVGCAVLLSL